MLSKISNFMSGGTNVAEDINIGQYNYNDIDLLAGQVADRNSYDGLFKVNNYSIDLGLQGQRAVKLLFNKAQELGLIEKIKDDIFVL